MAETLLQRQKDKLSAVTRTCSVRRYCINICCAEQTKLRRPIEKNKNKKLNCRKETVRLLRGLVFVKI